jgi:hypothetical protein
MKKPTSILTAKQQCDYADGLADGVPPDVIAEFDAYLAKVEERWKRDRRAVRTAVPRSSETFTISEPKRLPVHAARLVQKLQTFTGSMASEIQPPHA